MRVLIAITLLVWVAAPASAVNQLDNGNFEFGNLNFWNGYGVFGGAHTGDYFNMTPEQGSWFLATVTSFGSFDGGIYQQVFVGAGTYTLTGFGQGYNNNAFSYTPNQPSFSPGNTWAELRVDPTGGTNPAGGSVLNAGHVGDVSGWLPSTPLTFTLASPGFVTVFAHEHASFAFAGNWVGWDDIQLNPVPEPTALLLLSFAGLTLHRRRRSV